MFPPKCLWFTNKLWVNHGISDRVEKHRYFDSHTAHRQIWNIQHSRGTPMSVKTDVECGKVVLVRIFQTNMILFTERIWNLLKLREFLSNSEWKIWKQTPQFVTSPLNKLQSIASKYVVNCDQRKERTAP